MRKLLVLFLLASIGLLTGCYPGGPQTVGELDAIIATRDPQFAFSTVNTYALLDSVLQIRDPNNSSANIELSRSLDAPILNQVATNLNNLGYRAVDTTMGQQPDIIVQVSIVATRNVDVSYNYYGNYWGGYGYGGFGYYNPYYGGLYPPVSTTVSVYDVGTLLVEMYDLKHADATNKQIPLVWRGAVRGVLTGNTADTQERLLAGINQAFKQSTYLKP
jgi:hypothetical protein